MTDETSGASRRALRLDVLHETVCSYESPVTLSRQMLRLHPRDFATQSVEDHRVDLAPPATESGAGVDYFGNRFTQCLLASPHDRLAIVARSRVAVRSRQRAPSRARHASWEEVRDWPWRADDEGARAAAHHLYESPHVSPGDGLLHYAAPSFGTGRPLFDALSELNGRIHADFEFDPASTTVSTPLSEVLESRRGVCQDFAHLMIGCLRSLGLAARYVSGYLLTQPPPGMPRLVGSDASHAWVSVQCPGVAPEHGDWVDFDPTNDCLADEEHVTLAWGRDFSDVTPTRGVILGGGEQQLTVRVTVTPLDGHDGWNAAAALDAGAPRAVLDTNVWLDLLVFRDAGAEALLGAITTGRLVPVIDAFGLGEFARVLGYPLGRFSVPSGQRDALLARCRTLATVFERHATPDGLASAVLPTCRDPFDQPFLELARDARTRWLVTRDRDLLRLSRAAAGAGITIVTPRQCIEALAAAP